MLNDNCQYLITRNIYFFRKMTRKMMTRKVMTRKMPIHANTKFIFFRHVIIALILKKSVVAGKLAND